LAKTLSCTFIGKSPGVTFQLFPPNGKLPYLYLDQPYVILGETSTLDDFILFVQGRLNGKWLNIKKNISFLSAKKGGKALKIESALQQSYILYERYLRDDDPKHIAEARNLLEP